MKKIISLLLAALMMLSLAACGGAKDDEAGATPEPTTTEGPSVDLEASATDVEQANQTHIPPASATDLVFDEETFAKAQECIGLSVDELYEAIGRPAQEPTYGLSCLQEGAEDGMLLYDGFYVWTIRTQEGETVHDVDVDEEPLEDALEGELIDAAITEGEVTEG